jgi:glycosyltransferase involved in cell wall biosynthesis
MDLLFFLPLALLVVTGIGSLFYQYYIWLPALRKQTAPVNMHKQGVSVIIAARNQATLLQEHLPIWLSQSYDTYELVIVNDCSYDETADLLLSWQEKDARLKVVSLEEQPKYPTGRKFALTLGVKAATHDVLLFTDADTVPYGPNWISSMQQYYVSKAEIVLGLAFPRRKTGLLNVLSRFDSLQLALQYSGHALSRRAYMGLGKNLSYLKTLFFFHKGYVSHIKHAPGDDDLFVNNASNGGNVRVALDPRAFTEVVPDKSFTSFWDKKIRLQSSFRFYKSSDQRWLTAYMLLQWMLPVFTTVALVWYTPLGLLWYTALILWAVVWLNKLVFASVFARRVQLKGMLVWLPLIQPMHQLMQFFWTVRGYFAKPGW